MLYADSKILEKKYLPSSQQGWILLRLDYNLLSPSHLELAGMFWYPKREPHLPL